MSMPRPPVLPRPTWVLLASAWLLASCVSLDDYRRMSPEERAQRVCRGHPAVREDDAQIAHTRSLMADTDQALHRGYRVHTRCNTVDLPDNITQQCSRQGGTETCREVREARNRKECSDTLLPVDRVAEQANRLRYEQRLSALDLQRNLNWNRCFGQAVLMTPEEAYKAR